MPFYLISFRLCLTALALGALGIASTVSVSAQETSRKPNVLMIIADDLKPSIGAFGDPVAVTPAMDKLSAEGIIFLNNHCQQAVCGASRNSLFTGQLPNRQRIWHFGQKLRTINPATVTLPEHFKQNGYFTLSMGKVFDGRNVDGWGKQDAQSWSVPHSSAFGTARMGNYASEAVRERRTRAQELGELNNPVKHNLNPATERADVQDDAYNDGALAQLAISKLDERAQDQSQPFFMAVGFAKPHLPFTAPTKYWELFDRDKLKVADTGRAKDAPEIAYHNSGELRGAYTDMPKEGPIPPEIELELLHGYYASTAYVDAQIGKVIDHLEKVGLRENTIVILWGDHGYHLGDHDLWNKHTNFEQATRSPLIIAGPGVNGGVVTRTPTEFLDIYPTLCAMAGLPMPDQKLDGINLQPLFTNPDTALRQAARSQYPRGRDENKLMGYSIRSERFRLTEWIMSDYQSGQFNGPTEALELYDYANDPGETVNLAGDPEFAQTVTQMRPLLRELFSLPGAAQD